MRTCGAAKLLAAAPKAADDGALDGERLSARHGRGHSNWGRTSRWAGSCCGCGSLPRSMLEDVFLLAMARAPRSTHSGVPALPALTSRFLHRLTSRAGECATAEANRRDLHHARCDLAFKEADPLSDVLLER